MTDVPAPQRPDIPRARVEAFVATILEDAPASSVKGSATTAAQRRRPPTGATAAMVAEVIEELLR